MLLSKKIAFAAACLAVVGFAGFRVSAWAKGGLGSECRRRFTPDGRAACYERLFADRLAAYGVANAVATLDTLARSDRDVSRRAHEYAHGIGIEAYGRYPDIVATFTDCGDAAASGCRHGFMQAYFESRDRVTTPELEAFCRPFKGSGSSRWILFQCVDGMGHGLAMFYDHDLPHALAMCDQLREGWDRESCYGGAFMESDGVAKALVDWAANTDNALTFCGLVAPNGAAGRDACYHAVGEQIATLSANAATRAAECERAVNRDAIAACRRGAQL